MSAAYAHRLFAIDSHTGGEPTRVIVEGGPDVGTGPLAERLTQFRSRFDRFRSAVVNEPRGSDTVVGALLTDPCEADSTAAVIFFNNVGYLGMCGHGVIGLVTTLAHLGRISTGPHRIETPVGIVTATLHENGRVSVENVPSYRQAQGICVEVPGHGPVVGDVAWGGNWFFLTDAVPWQLSLRHIRELTEFAWRIRQAVNAAGFPEVDHVELFGPAVAAEAHARNFVLCPGRAYDRSPCGTGTSAKLACLAADSSLHAGDEWVQESVIGSTFTASFRWHGDAIIPTITGRAFVSAETTLLIHDDDRFGWGIRP